jgi:hypothetical protein
MYPFGEAYFDCNTCLARFEHESISCCYAIIASVTVFATGCATKKYVRNTAAPIQAKLDQVGEQTNKNSQSIEETRAQVKDVDERAQNGINAANERAASADRDALTADQHASEAMNRANEMKHREPPIEINRVLINFAG